MFIPLKLESVVSMMTYSPHRILRQFGYDQGALWIVEDTCINVWEVKSRFVGNGRNNTLASLLNLLAAWLVMACDHQWVHYTR